LHREGTSVTATLTNAGPLFDRFGRRRPLLVGVVAYVLTSALCALSPTIETPIVARFV
jgi:MFS transporter, DHA1 family, multidrug resistance protein